MRPALENDTKQRPPTVPPLPSAKHTRDNSLLLGCCNTCASAFSTPSNFTDYLCSSNNNNDKKEACRATRAGHAGWQSKWPCWTPDEHNERRVRRRGGDRAGGGGGWECLSFSRRQERCTADGQGAVGRAASEHCTVARNRARKAIRQRGRRL